MLKISDIVLYQDTRWKVVTHAKDLRICGLVSFDGAKMEVPDDAGIEQGLRHLFNPVLEWPFLISKTTRGGPFKYITRGGLSLISMLDWVPGDFIKSDGALYFNPRLQIRVSEVLVGVHRDNTRTRLTVTRNFGTIDRRKARVLNPPKVRGPQSALDRLMTSSVFDEE